MPELDRVRIEIGFDGGQIAGALVAHEAADELERRLSAGAADEALALAAEEGTLIVRLAKVTYVKRFAREGRVGFGS